MARCSLVAGASTAGRAAAIGNDVSPTRPRDTARADRGEHDRLDRQHDDRRRTARESIQGCRVCRRPTCEVIGPGVEESQSRRALSRNVARTSRCLLLAHLDVVEAKRADWTYDPFVLTERDGYFYGRGTQDQKGGAAMLVTTLLRLKSEKASFPIAT